MRALRGDHLGQLGVVARVVNQDPVFDGADEDRGQHHVRPTSSMNVTWAHRDRPRRCRSNRFRRPLRVSALPHGRSCGDPEARGVYDSPVILGTTYDLAARVTRQIRAQALHGSRHEAARRVTCRLRLGPLPFGRRDPLQPGRAAMTGTSSGAVLPNTPRVPKVPQTRGSRSWRRRVSSESRQRLVHPERHGQPRTALDSTVGPGVGFAPGPASPMRGPLRQRA